jgi:hypothetical protein
MIDLVVGHDKETLKEKKERIRSGFEFVEVACSDWQAGVSLFQKHESA